MLADLTAQDSSGGFVQRDEYYNAARIWKLYGTLACKGDNIPARPHRIAEILETPETLQAVNLEQLIELADHIPPSATIPPRGHAGKTGLGVIEQFNQANDVAALLEHYGYRPASSGRYCAPSSISGLPGVILLDDGRSCYSHHNNDVLADNHAHDAFDVLRLLEHGGDLKAAIADAMQQLGIEPSLGTAAHGASVAESILNHHASKQSSGFDQSLLDRANGKVSLKVKEAKPREVFAFPSSSLAALQHYIETQVPVVYPEAAQAGALAIAGLAASRLYETALGDPLSLHISVVSQSIGELRYVQNAVSRIIQDCGLRKMIREGRLSTAPIVIKTLMRSPATLYLSDDYGQMMAFSRRQPAGTQEIALGLIGKLWTGSTLPVEIDENNIAKLVSDGQSQQTSIFHPALNLLALVAHDQMADMLKLSELGRGNLEQILCVITDAQNSIVQEPRKTDTPEWIIQHILKIRQLPPTVGDIAIKDIFGGNAELPPSLMTVPIHGQFDAVYTKLSALSTRDTRPLVTGARLIVRRIAGILAVWENPGHPVITQPLIDWSGRYVVARLQELLEQFNLLSTEDGKVGPYEKIADLVTKSSTKGVTIR